MDCNRSSPSPGRGNPEDHTWLAFSLSNQHYYPTTTSITTPPPHHHPHHLSLFQHPLSPGEVGHVVDNGANNHHHHELPFLGDGGGGGMLQVGLFPAVDATAVAGAGSSERVIYEAVRLPEQKAVVSSYLGGFPSEQQQQQLQVVQQSEQQQQQLAVVAPSRAVTAVSSSSNKKVTEGFGHRTSIYRGVTRHRWTGRYEAHLWDNSCRREGQSRKGRQVYLGGYDKEEKAARAYDLAALKYWGPTTTTNFLISDYEKELEDMKNMSRQEFVASLRRKSSGFSRGASIYRGVTRHHQHGRWQARIGRVAGNKDLYLGTFSTQEEAAEAYDIAAIKFRGLNAVTNFDISRYDVKSIISSNLPVGGMSNKSKSISDHSMSNDIKPLDTSKPDCHQDQFATALPFAPSPHQPTTSPNLNFALPLKPHSSPQHYNLPALGTLDHTHHSEGMEYGLAYENNNNNGYDASNDDGNNATDNSGSGNSWIVTPSLHSFQNPKQSLSVLQAAIFGIE